MLGPFTFTFTFESEEFEKFEKVAAAVDLYWTMITTRAPDGANYVPGVLLQAGRSNCTFTLGDSAHALDVEHNMLVLGFLKWRS